VLTNGRLAAGELPSMPMPQRVLAREKDLIDWIHCDPGVKAPHLTLERLTLESGGDDAGIVLDDAYPVAIAPRSFDGAFLARLG
jgi:hypothetical protein